MERYVTVRTVSFAKRDADGHGLIDFPMGKIDSHQSKGWGENPMIDGAEE